MIHCAHKVLFRQSSLRKISVIIIHRRCGRKELLNVQEAKNRRNYNRFQRIRNDI